MTTKRPEPSEGCSKRIYRDSFSGTPCARRATVTVDGKRYCSQHDPAAVEKRRADRNAKWDREWEAQRKARARATHVKELTTRLIELAATSPHSPRSDCLHCIAVQIQRPARDAPPGTAADSQAPPSDSSPQEPPLEET